jgi:hypothetical protein
MTIYYNPIIECYVARAYRGGDVFVGHGSNHYHAICACLRGIYNTK